MLQLKTTRRGSAVHAAATEFHRQARCAILEAHSCTCARCVQVQVLCWDCTDCQCQCQHADSKALDSVCLASRAKAATAGAGLLLVPMTMARREGHSTASLRPGATHRHRAARDTTHRHWASAIH